MTAYNKLRKILRPKLKLMPPFLIGHSGTLQDSKFLRKTGQVSSIPTLSFHKLFPIQNVKDHIKFVLSVFEVELVIFCLISIHVFSSSCPQNLASLYAKKGLYGFSNGIQIENTFPEIQ